MVNPIAASVLNSVMDYVMFAIGLVAGLWIFKRCAKLLPADRVHSSSPRLKRGFILFFVTVAITAGFFLCVDIIITAIAKNFIIASQGHLPGVSLADFNALFPDFDIVVAQAFLFAHFIPITQYCLLAFGPVFLFLLTIKWSITARKARIAGIEGTRVEKATTEVQHEMKNADLKINEGLEDVRVNHLQFMSRILHLDERKGLNVVKALSLNILLWLVIPLAMTEIVILNPFQLDPALVANWNFVYFLSLPSEVILGGYLAYFSVSQLFQTPPTPSPVARGEKVKKRSSKIVKVLYVSFLIYDFGLMWVVLLNYTPETIRSGSSVLALLLQVIIPADNPLRIISIIFVLFPIDTLLILLLQLLLFFRTFFQTELPAEKKKISLGPLVFGVHYLWLCNILHREFYCGFPVDVHLVFYGHPDRISGGASVITGVLSQGDDRGHSRIFCPHRVINQAEKALVKGQT